MASIQASGDESGGVSTARPGKRSDGSGSADGAGTSGATIEQTIAEDPLMKFVQRRWREIAFLLLAVFAVLYGKNVFEETRRESRSRSADLLLNLQSQVEQLRVGIEELKKKEQEANKSSDGASDKKGESQEATVKESGKEKQEEEVQALRKRLEQNIDSAFELNRALAQERAPYSELPELYTQLLSSYRAIIKKEKGQEDSGISSSKLREILSAKALEQGGLLAELKIFQGALVLLEKEGASSEVVGILRDLVAQGNITGVPALLALSALVESSGSSESPETAMSSEELKGLAASYIERNPEQAAMLRRELPQLL